MLLLPAAAEPQPHGPRQQPAQVQPPLAQPVQVAAAQRPHNSATGTQPPAWSHLPQHTPALQHQPPPPSAAVGPFPGGVAPAPLEELPLAQPPGNGLRFAAQQVPVGGAGGVGAAQPLLAWSAQPSGQHPSHAPQHQAWQSSAEMGMNCNGKRPMAVGTDTARQACGAAPTAANGSSRWALHSPTKPAAAAGLHCCSDADGNGNEGGRQGGPTGTSGLGVSLNGNVVARVPLGCQGDLEGVALSVEDGSAYWVPLKLAVGRAGEPAVGSEEGQCLQAVMQLLQDPSITKVTHLPGLTHALSRHTVPCLAGAGAGAGCST
ncbi:hypothetical protein HaLaN_11117 [Haematococcus lacustris]|uniref:Uncharacterized protein n=1 Tax=Haematococcus lacustris TaxID=44745 RepID=A0A699YXJ1_HAELA|nr:hypothetical protein HaLaN_11117 [Haematococcus lacustris]